MGWCKSAKRRRSRGGTGDGILKLGFGVCIYCNSSFSYAREKIVKLKK